jgi:hypothetical protein
LGLYLSRRWSLLMAPRVDEKSGIHAIDRAQPMLQLARVILDESHHDYERKGPMTLFAALDIAAASVISETHRRYPSSEFRQWLYTVEINVSLMLSVHVVLDNFRHSRHRLEQNG